MNAFSPASSVLAYIADELPEEYAKAYPDERTWGRTARAQRAARLAEDQFAAAPRPQPEVT